MTGKLFIQLLPALTHLHLYAFAIPLPLRSILCSLPCSFKWNEKEAAGEQLCPVMETKDLIGTCLQFLAYIVSFFLLLSGSAFKKHHPPPFVLLNGDSGKP